MALRFATGFEHYATADLTKVWTTITNGSGAPTIDATGGRRGSGALSWSLIAAGAGQGLGITIPDAGATCVVGFALKVSRFDFVNWNGQSTDLTSASSSNVDLFPLLRLNGTNQVWYRINADATISAHRGSSGSSVLLGASTAPVGSNGVWSYLEIKTVIHNTTGSVTVKRDGVTILSLTNIDTNNGTATDAWNELVFRPSNTNAVTGCRWDIDDLYICDGTGSYNTDCLGDRRVDALYVTGVGNSNMSTPSTGTDRSATVDETTPNGDTDYNTFASVSDKDTYAFGNHPVSGATISAIQLSSWVKKADAGAALVAGVARISGTDYDHATPQAPTADYATLRHIWDRSPVDGTSVITTAVIDAAEFGLKKTA